MTGARPVIRTRRTREVAAPLMIPFSSRVTAASIMDVPAGCSCTWVPGPAGRRLKFVDKKCETHRML